VTELPTIKTNNMKEFFINYGWVAYLGGALGGLLSIGVTDWRLWATIIPVVILVNIKEKHNKENKL